MQELLKRASLAVDECDVLRHSKDVEYLCQEEEEDDDYRDPHKE